MARSHTHNWQCSDVPAMFFCKCGAERYFDRETQTYKIMECKKCYGKGYFFPNKNTDEVVMCDCSTMEATK